VRRRSGLDTRALGFFVRRVEAVPHSGFPVLEGRISFADPSAGLVPWTGWGEPEPFGRWSVAPDARVRFRLHRTAGDRVRAVRIAIASVFSPFGRGQRLEVTWDGESVLDARIPASMAAGPPGAVAGGAVDVLVPPRRPGSGDLIEMRLHLSEPASPRSIGISADTRLLGLAVSHIEAIR
jgi:hypothetical protein